MKKKDVPQDKGLMEGRFEDVCYAVDENGNYVPVLSAGWEPKNAAMRQAWEVINEQVEEARRMVLIGKYSPIYYYMEKNMMDIRLLAEYMGLPKRKVKRHMKPSVFEKLDEEILKRYAEVFNITLGNLINLKEDRAGHE
jgi:hypothetical protein